MNRNFYFLVGQKYDPSDGKWKHPYRKSRLQKFDGDGTLTASETESCAYILGNSSLKVLYFEQYNVVVMIRWRQIGFRQPVAQNAFPAVFATISTGEGNSNERARGNYGNSAAWKSFPRRNKGNAAAAEREGGDEQAHRYN